MLEEQASETQREITLLHFAKIMFVVVMKLPKMRKTKVLIPGAEGQHPVGESSRSHRKRSASA